VLDYHCPRPPSSLDQITNVAYYEVVDPTRNTRNSPAPPDFLKLLPAASREGPTPYPISETHTTSEHSQDLPRALQWVREVFTRGNTPICPATSPLIHSYEAFHHSFHASWWQSACGRARVFTAYGVGTSLSSHASQLIVVRTCSTAAMPHIPANQ
jgi:hypothetical protein